MSTRKNLKTLNESTQGKKEAGRKENRGLNTKALGQKEEEEELGSYTLKSKRRNCFMVGCGRGGGGQLPRISS